MDKTWQLRVKLRRGLEQALVEHLDQFIGDYVLQIAVAFVVVASATALWIIFRRRRYVKSAELKRVIEPLRLEVGRSIDETRAVIAKKTAAVSHKLFSAIKPIGEWRILTFV